jgi:hypothetical protein
MHESLSLRHAIRRGDHTGLTTGLVPGFVQANLVVLPKLHAADFLRFCEQNTAACPVLETSDAGSPFMPALGDYKESEAEVTARAALTDYGVTLRWLEGQSRDTSENARFLAPMLKRDGVQHILLVTDAWHMPRSVVAFERAGLTVTAAPIGYLLSTQNDWLEWLPSASGLSASQQVLREWLGLTASRWLTV